MPETPGTDVIAIVCGAVGLFLLYLAGRRVFYGSGRRRFVAVGFLLLGASPLLIVAALIVSHLPFDPR